jgi:transposase, IS5 family
MSSPVFVSNTSQQQTLLNYFQSTFGTTRTESLLARIDQVVPWSAIEQRIALSREYAPGGVGRPRVSIVMLIKILFLQGMYHLSDPEAEDQIRDRMSFQKFLGICRAEDIPDETTLCRFRNELVQK